VRVLWVKAPLLLRRFPALLFAVVAVSLLAALAAVSAPLLRTGVASRSLDRQVREMSPLAAGIEIRLPAARARGDVARRRAAARLARSVEGVNGAVVTSMVPVQAGGAVSPGLPLVAMARTGAVAHVRRERSDGGPGVWIADSTARLLHLGPGRRIVLTEHVFMGRAAVVSLRVAGVYRSLEADCCSSYWANWVQDVRSPDPDSPPPPAFVLMSERLFLHVARTLHPIVENRFELPVATTLTVASARAEARRFGRLEQQIESADSPAIRMLGCGSGTTACETSSSLTAAVATATRDVAAVSPAFSLFAACGFALALGLACAAGLFLVRRRGDEVELLFARGEPAGTFATRVGVEALLPSLLGSAVGAGAGLGSLGALAPAGAIDRGTIVSAVEYAVAGALLAAVGVAAGAYLAYPRIGRRSDAWSRVSRVPWEVAPIAAAGVLYAALRNGHGLAHDVTGAAHPRLTVFFLPILAAVGGSALAGRALRPLLRGRAERRAPWLYLAVRRLSAAGVLLVSVIAAGAAGFGTFAYASTLSASLQRSIDEKAYVSNGSDVQGIVDPTDRLTSRFPFPVALVQADHGDVSFDSGTPVDLVSGDPEALRETLRWGPGWSDDPRPLLARLDPGSTRRLRVIATPDAPARAAIVDQGVRIPIEIVGRAAVPGATAGQPALLASSVALRRLAAGFRISYPAPQAEGLVWAKGPPRLVERVLGGSSLAPTFTTTLAHIRDDPAVAAGQRGYRYASFIGAGASLLALLGLLLYLQARQRSQLIASAFSRRMGLTGVADAGALGVEAASVMLFAALVGGAVAVLAGRSIVPHLDPLPQYAPAPPPIVPWSVLTIGLAAGIAVAGLIGAAAAAVASRLDAAEALRVA
jgi:putative ABC transport system permease protein